MVRFYRSETPSTQLQALKNIQALVAYSPVLREYLNKAQANILLSTLPKLLGTRYSARIYYDDHEYDQLLAASRRALYVVEDNELNRLAKQLSRRLTRRVDWTLVEGWCRLGADFLKFLRHATHLF